MEVQPTRPPIHILFGMDSETTNGVVESIDPVQVRYAAERERKRGFSLETDMVRQSARGEIARLKEERLALQKKASEHAGNIGLIYKAEDNSFTRVVIVDSEPILPERPALALLDEPSPHAEADAPLPLQKPVAPEPLPRPAVPDLETVPRPADVDAKWQRAATWKSIVSWIGAAIVGLFIGFGLLTIAGLPYSRPEDRTFLIGGLLVGVAAIVGIKLLMDVMWSEAGRRYMLGRLSPPPTAELKKEAAASSRWYLALAGLVSVGLILVEGWLGGQAIVAYSAKSSFDGNPTVPASTAILVAMAVSTATMLFSGFLGHQKGQRSVTHEDVRNRHYELALREHEVRTAKRDAEFQADLADWQASQDRRLELEQKRHDLELQTIEDHRRAHEESLEHWREKLNGSRQRHDDGLAEREPRVEDLESYQKQDDYRALCAYIGQIDALNSHIADTEKALTGEMISRGYAKQYLA
ncbi:MAG: hypothetical protein HONBIEJF_02169 [Fimbriimonadaceae bacterium]|nr:hypothetical protein [Fimbriimonadaceae bacterium]